MKGNGDCLALSLDNTLVSYLPLPSRGAPAFTDDPSEPEMQAPSFHQPISSLSHATPQSCYAHL